MWTAFGRIDTASTRDATAGRLRVRQSLTLALDRARHAANWTAAKAQDFKGRWTPSVSRRLLLADPAMTILEKAVHSGFTHLDTVGTYHESESWNRKLVTVRTAQRRGRIRPGCTPVCRPRSAGFRGCTAAAHASLFCRAWCRRIAGIYVRSGEGEGQYI